MLIQTHVLASPSSRSTAPPRSQNTQSDSQHRTVRPTTWATDQVENAWTSRSACLGNSEPSTPDQILSQSRLHFSTNQLLLATKFPNILWICIRTSSKFEIDLLSPDQLYLNGSEQFWQTQSPRLQIIFDPGENNFNNLFFTVNIENITLYEIKHYVCTVETSSV